MFGFSAAEHLPASFPTLINQVTAMTQRSVGAEGLERSFKTKGTSVRSTRCEAKAEAVNVNDIANWLIANLSDDEMSALWDRLNHPR